MYSHKGGFDKKETNRYPDGSYDIITVSSEGMCKKNFYPNKNLSFSGKWRFGNPIETHTSYFENGQKEWETRHNGEGNLHGLQKIWFSDGTLKSEQFRNDGHLVGTSQWFYPNGNIEGERTYGIEGEGSCNVKSYDREGNGVLMYEFSIIKSKSKSGDTSTKSTQVKHGWENWYQKDGTLNASKLWNDGKLYKCGRINGKVE